MGKHLYDQHKNHPMNIEARHVSVVNDYLEIAYISPYNLLNKQTNHALQSGGGGGFAQEQW